MLQLWMRNSNLLAPVLGEMLVEPLHVTFKSPCLFLVLAGHNYILKLGTHVCHTCVSNFGWVAGSFVHGHPL